MKILAFTDPHAHNYKEFSEAVGEQGINSRLADVLDVLERVRVRVAAEKFDVVVFDGDLFHLKNNVDSLALELTLKAINKIRFACHEKFVMNPGNHDFYYWNRKPVLIEMFQGFVGASITEQLIVHEDDKGKRWSFYLFPYNRNSAEINNALRAMTPIPNSIGLFHQPVVGTFYNSILVKEGLDPDLVAKTFTYSFVGHFHGHEQIRPNMWHIGSLLMLNFGEATQKKGWMEIDTEKGEAVFVENTESPVFKSLVLESGQAIDFDDIKNFYKITVKGTTAPSGLDRIRWKRVNYDVSTDRKQRVSIGVSDSYPVIMEKYIGAKGTDLDPAYLLEIGKRYLA